MRRNYELYEFCELVCKNFAAKAANCTNVSQIFVFIRNEVAKFNNSYSFNS